MANSPGYIVARLVPESPVSGAVFGTYLDGLRLQAFDANTGFPLSDYAYSSPLNLFFDATGSLAFVSAITLASTPITEPYGSTLTFDSTDGIPVGSVIASADGTTIPASFPLQASSNLQVSTVTAGTAGSPGEVQLSGTLPNYVPAGTVVYFIGQYPPSLNPANAPVFSFSLLTSSPATTRDGQPQTAADPLFVLHFEDVSGVTVGMAVAGSSIAPGTTVAETDPTTNSVTVSQPLLGSFSSPSSVSFTLNPPYLFFQLKPLSGSPPAKPTELTFGANGTDGVATGMTLSPISGLIALGTTVTRVTSTTVTLSQGLQGPLPAAGQEITFTFPLSSGIGQHTEQVNGSTTELAAVATAIIPLNPAPSPITVPTTADCPSGTTLTFDGTDGIGAEMPVSGLNIAEKTTVQSVTATTVTLSTGVSADVPSGTMITFTIVRDYFDINIEATRGSDIIPVSNTFYNVPVSQGSNQLAPYQYTAIPDSDTSLYITLPPQPGT